MFFDSWSGLWRVLVVGSMAYAALIVLLRVAGPRSLAKLNAFDFVVTIALGSTLSSVLLDRSIPLATGVTAFALLLGLQYVVSWLSSRWQRFEAITRGAPIVVFSRGRFLRAAMLDARLAEGDVLSAVRRARVGSLDHVAAVVLETSGELSVIVGVYTTPGAEETSSIPPNGRAGAPVDRDALRPSAHGA